MKNANENPHIEVGPLLRFNWAIECLFSFLGKYLLLSYFGLIVGCSSPLLEPNLDLFRQPAGLEARNISTLVLLSLPAACPRATQTARATCDREAAT